ncbi:hypothetical protein A3207_09135 [Candidatus Methanomassiliicoccus intestinalis]|nr:MAG: hypothetical protein A3207_09135 [Candidatus Methanomassiliicoccus intestinalis]
MMLAVPLASSSNLFVDGGQTNSNGDAPMLSASTSLSVSKYTWPTPANNQIINTFIIDSEASYDMFIDKYLKLTTTNSNSIEGSFGGENRSDAQWKADPWLAIVYQSTDTVNSLELTITNSNIKKIDDIKSQNSLKNVVIDGKATISGSSLNFSGTSHGIVVGLNGDLGLSSDKFHGDYDILLKINNAANPLHDTVTYADPNDIEIVDSWIVYDQASLDKIGTYVGKDIQNSNFREKWDGSLNAWIAIAYTAPEGVGSVDFTAKLNDGDYSTITTSVGNSNGTHVFAAFVNGSHTNEDCFNLAVGNDSSIAKYHGEYFVNVAGANSSYSFAFGADAGEKITVTFNLNVPDSEGRISLDDVKANITKSTDGLDVTFSYDPDNKNIVYATFEKNEVSITGLLSLINPAKAGYIFSSWTDDNGVQYESGSDKITKSMILNANWEIIDNWVQAPIDVIYDGTTYKYSLALYSADEKTVNVSSSNIISLLPEAIKDKGYVINVKNANTDNDLPTVYSYTVKENNADGKDLKSTGLVSMNADSTVYIEYALTSYTKITVSSEIFGDAKAVMYAYNSNTYTYNQVWNALIGLGEDNKNATAANLGLKKSFGGEVSGSNKALNVKLDDNKYTTSDGKYKVTGWDSGIALDDTKTAPGTDLTLNSELNGYNVIFMVNGQYEIVYVPYGQLTADKCTLNVSGLNHWVYMEYSDYENDTYKFQTFNFNSTSDVKAVNDKAVSGEKPQFVFIACFEKADSTAYAVFNASNNGIAGNYGNKYVKSIIIPGKAVAGTNSTVIPLPAVSPVYETKNVLIGYSGYVSTGENPSAFGVKDSVTSFNADIVSYKYTITFYNGSDVNGIFYYGGDSQTSSDSIETGLVAFSYNGVAYKHTNGITLTGDALKAFNNILYPAKDGYKVTQWKDTDGNVMLDNIKVERNDDKTVKSSSYEVKFKKISSDMSFYAGFESQKYTIVYNSNIAASPNPMTQTGYVDESLKLLGEATFNNDGYKLVSWNTRADGEGTSYKVGESFSINGSAYEKLDKINANDKGFTLYAIWEKVGSSDNPSGNTDGNNDSDNTALYLIAGMLAVIAILAIVGIVLMRRK